MALDLERFSDEDIEQAMEWVRLTQHMLAMAPEANRNVLKLAVENVTAKCNDRWPLARGSSIEISEDDLGVDMSGFTENVTVAFAGRTALCLFAGVDGPHMTAQVLIEGIDTLADEIEGRQQ